MSYSKKPYIKKFWNKTLYKKMLRNEKLCNKKIYKISLLIKKKTLYCNLKYLRAFSFYDTRAYKSSFPRIFRAIYKIGTFILFGLGDEWPNEIFNYSFITTFRNAREYSEFRSDSELGLALGNSRNEMRIAKRVKREAGDQWVA